MAGWAVKEHVMPVHLISNSKGIEGGLAEADASASMFVQYIIRRKFCSLHTCI